MAWTEAAVTIKERNGFIEGKSAVWAPNSERRVGTSPLRVCDCHRDYLVLGIKFGVDGVVESPMHDVQRHRRSALKSRTRIAREFDDVF